MDCVNKNGSWKNGLFGLWFLINVFRWIGKLFFSIQNLCFCFTLNGMQCISKRFHGCYVFYFWDEKPLSILNDNALYTTNHTSKRNSFSAFSFSESMSPAVIRAIRFAIKPNAAQLVLNYRLTKPTHSYIHWLQSKLAF